MSPSAQQETQAPRANGAPQPNPPVDIAVALRPGDSTAVPKILEDISSFGSAPSVDHDNTRLGLLAKARELVRALETPRETMIKHNWAQVC